MKELLKVQTEYIALLEKECTRLSGTSMVHSYLKPDPFDVQEGKRLRAKIKSLT